MHVITDRILLSPHPAEDMDDLLNVTLAKADASIATGVHDRRRPARLEQVSPLDRLFTPGEIAAHEILRCMVRSMIRARVLDANFAEELQERAMAAINAGGSAAEVLAAWLPIQTMLELVTAPEAWTAQPGLPQGGGEGLPAMRTLRWPRKTGLVATRDSRP
jgi:hypothetical protein